MFWSGFAKPVLFPFLTSGLITDTANLSFSGCSLMPELTRMVVPSENERWGPGVPNPFPVAGLPGESPLVRVLEDESRSRLGRFNQKDVSMVFSSVMRLHPSSPHPLVESCLSSLERHLEKERHPQTLFLLLSYYRLRAQALQGHPASDQQLINNRKILRLVRHTLGQVSAMREHELALLDEMLALCAQEANNKALEAIFSSQLFYENRQERFIRSMAGEGRVCPGRVPALPTV